VEGKEELGIALRPQYNNGDALALVEGQAMRVPRNAPPISDESFVTKLDALAKAVPIDAPWKAPRAAEWDAMTYADYIAAANLSAEDRAMLDLSTCCSFGVLPDAISFLYLLHVYHFAGGPNQLEAIEGGAQESRISGGSYAILLKMAETLGNAVRLSSPVTEIRGWDKSGPVEIETTKGIVTARRAILALGPPQAASIRFTPALPATKTALIKAWPMTRSMLKVFMSYEKPFWREKGLSGSVFNFGGAFLWAADASPDDESIGVLGTLGLSEDGLTPALRKAAILDSLAKCLGPETMKPTAYVEQDWGQETYTRGCTSPLGKGVLTRHGAALRAPTGRLLWAGTETATIWSGAMDGAVRAGQRAAGEALAALVQEERMQAA
jgi:monoamine oxidase